MNAHIVRPARLGGLHSAALPIASSRSVSAGGIDRDILPGAAADMIVEMVTFGDRQPIAVGPRPAEYLCRLADGWAYREHILRNGARQITDVLVPGDLIPAAMFARRETIACGAARVMILSEGCLQGYAAKALQHMKARAREAELRMLRARLVSLGRRDARTRIAHLFAELHARLDRSGRVAGDTFACPLTQEQVADVLGLTPVHVNRTLQKLRSEGLLTLSRRSAFIPDIGRLRAAAGFDAEDEEYGEASGYDPL